MSVVISSPAFAYDQPNSVVDSVVSFNPQTQLVGVVISSNASAQCNASAAATFPNARIDSRTITATSLAMETGYQWRANQNLVGTATNLNIGESVTRPTDTSGNPPTGELGRMRKVETDTNTVGNVIAGGDSFRIDVVTVLACEYTGDTENRHANNDATYTA